MQRQKTTPLRSGRVRRAGSRHAIPQGLREWVLHGDSLTQKLRDACPQQLSLQVVEQSWRRPLRSERAALGLRLSDIALVREVVLGCDGRPWVFARTVIPRTTLRGRGGSLCRLGRRPLGEMLFSHRAVRRGELDVASLRPGQALYELAVAQLGARPQRIWGRRSVFHFAGQPLLVSEWFAPHVGRAGLPAARRDVA